MSFPGGAEGLIQLAERDPQLRDFVTRLREMRYTVDPATFEEMLWLLAAQGICLGARTAVQSVQEASARSLQ